MKCSYKLQKEVGALANCIFFCVSRPFFWWFSAWLWESPASQLLSSRGSRAPKTSWPSSPECKLLTKEREECKQIPVSITSVRWLVEKQSVVLLFFSWQNLKKQWQWCFFTFSFLKPTLSSGCPFLLYSLPCFKPFMLFCKIIIHLMEISPQLWPFSTFFMLHGWM